MTALLAIVCGAFVGFSLGLIGGGGSILATPMMLYVIGMPPHRAIGTGALAVSANAFLNFASHARAGTVRWVPAALFAIVGILGAYIGSTLGKALNGHKLLFLFAILMIVVGLLMLRPRGKGGDAERKLDLSMGARTAVAALIVGAMSGFFGIGGGFLIVPGLVFATAMPMINAIGSSLLSVGTFGATTAVNYAISGLIDWPVAGEFIGGGLVGGLLGMTLALRLAHYRRALNIVFSALIFIVAIYMLWKNIHAFTHPAHKHS